MREPRRIFKGSALRHSRRHSGWSRTLALAGISVIGTGALSLLGAPTDWLGRAAPLPALLSAAPGTVAVIDGDTLRLGGQVVRLAGVVAPARGDRCAGTVDCGALAAQTLAALVRDRLVECSVSGGDGQGRPIATCNANGVDIATALVSQGLARAIR